MNHPKKKVKTPFHTIIQKIFHIIVQKSCYHLDFINFQDKMIFEGPTKRFIDASNHIPFKAVKFSCFPNCPSAKSCKCKWSDKKKDVANPPLPVVVDGFIDPSFFADFPGSFSGFQSSHLSFHLEVNISKNASPLYSEQCLLSNGDSQPKEAADSALWRYGHPCSRPILPGRPCLLPVFAFPFHSTRSLTRGIYSKIPI